MEHFHHLTFLAFPLLALLLLLPTTSLSDSLLQSTSSISSRKLQIPPKDGGGSSLNGLKMKLVQRESGYGGKAQMVKAGMERSEVRVGSLQSWIRLAMLKTKSLIEEDNQGESYKALVYATLGGYFTTISIGNPRVEAILIVDTGSDLLWIQCDKCIKCFNQSTPIFNPSSSSTYKSVSCGDPLCQVLPSPPQCNTKSSSSDESCPFTYKYGDGSSTSGDLAYDSVTLMDANSSQLHTIPQIAFGCAHDTSSDEFAQAKVGGIMGLGQGQLSILSQLSNHIKFSYCLVSLDDSPSKSSPMFLGDSASLSGSNILSTPIITNPLSTTFYYLSLKGISVAGKLLDIPAGTFDLQVDGDGGIVIDSGTTVTFLVDAAYQPLVNAFKSAIGEPVIDGTSKVGLEICFKKGITKIPSLTFHFEGADLDLPTANYFLDVENLSCLAFAKSQDISIFGNIQQQNYHFLYDLAAHKLSFTPATCDTL